MIQEAEDQVSIIRERLKAAHSRQKTNYDRHHLDVHYDVGDQAYLRVTPLKGVHRFGIKGKLAPRYVGPFHVLSKQGKLAYQLSFLQTSLRCMTSSMCLNSSVASKILFVVLITKLLISRRI